MPDWLDKAKEAAKNAAEEAKKLAEAAKNADYGAMMDKTKNMAMHAADEAKKAAGNIMKKDEHPQTPETTASMDTPQSSAPQPSVAPPVAPPNVAGNASLQKAQILAKIAQIEQLLDDVKNLLK